MELDITARPVKVIGMVDIIYRHRTFARQQEPQEGRTYELNWRTPNPARIAPGLSLGLPSSNDHFGWLRVASLNRYRRELEEFSTWEYVFRCRITYLSGPFWIGSTGEGGRHAKGCCWVERAGKDDECKEDSDGDVVPTDED
ncbi:hypothetical protein F4818DRAFT_454126 [Hypoxylon cercidicola]|nr:hypothetical protein F4818DRAFT_454126 [Hypoxylon cercidicola]